MYCTTDITACNTTLSGTLKNCVFWHNSSAVSPYIQVISYIEHRTTQRAVQRRIQRHLLGCCSHNKILVVPTFSKVLRWMCLLTITNLLFNSSRKLSIWRHPCSLPKFKSLIALHCRV
ncbi:hypothetical protein Plhal710r2_c006g0027011 [Plasmopara halstedii]